mmetsp:Transcript_15409/g.31601  ORF Transcript_15409/g.31601 Transcript_15409/m.31601 type:complete len:318 (+) Transcript_15409:113-1066(+)|eukprot:CAMPEP_0201119090 /NCGR_PEP_ID=MMETSP0850-20130426/3284_1 /ASSEMBLY_ACC=CAM_ASM_000622 /TAXON_ID=183588 /ORGANISM="Pseudo-nitzschia fraudulenta, Strain WWA7" /LENGTH=317 /DNA_ID=CAMNT_0047384671 /DNA_START=110 /DNA_END=1063 /DNA_ORIENTATION=-
MAFTAALRSAFVLALTVVLPLTLGFHVGLNSPYQRHAKGQQSSSGFVSSRLSPSLSSQRVSRGLRLDGIWGASSSSSSSSSSSDDDGTDETGDEEPTSEIEDVVDTSLSSTDDASSDEVGAAATTTTTTKSTTSTDTGKSLLVLLNEIGNNFQGMAQKSTAKGYQCENQYAKILHASKACVYYSLFIIYRAYRGFFVLLPATFRQVYQQMEAAMNTGNLSMEEAGFTEDGEEYVSNSSKVRTKATVAVLTSVVTVSYVIGGFLKMASKFVRTIAKTSDVPKSFGAAADEMSNFEGRISRVGKINGDDGTIESSGLAP